MNIDCPTVEKTTKKRTSDECSSIDPKRQKNFVDNPVKSTAST